MQLAITFPIEISLGDIQINLHLLSEVLAFFIGYRYYLWQKRNTIDPISDINRIWIFIGAAFGAFLFSRILGGLENPYKFFDKDTSWLYYYGNKTIVGGLLGGLIGVETIKKLIGETHSSGDLMAFPIILGLIIGRIGCFSMGIYEETYGTETQLLTGMNLGDGLKRHPVSLYEIVYLILVWVLLYQFKRIGRFKEGYLFQFTLIAYLIFRFLLDFIKPGITHILGFTSIQLACLGGLVYYIKTIYKLIFSPSKIWSHEQ